MNYLIKNIGVPVCLILLGKITELNTIHAELSLNIEDGSKSTKAKKKITFVHCCPTDPKLFLGIFRPALLKSGSLFYIHYVKNI